MTILALIVIRTPNPEALLPFYKALGLEFQREQHGSGPIHFAGTLGEVILEIYPPKKNQTEVEFSAPMLGFRVDSLEGTLEKLSEIGIDGGEIKASEWGRFCNVVDFDGRAIQLMEK